MLEKSSSDLLVGRFLCHIYHPSRGWLRTSIVWGKVDIYVLCWLQWHLAWLYVCDVLHAWLYLDWDRLFPLWDQGIQ
jgi:hypothetical protein